MKRNDLPDLSKLTRDLNFEQKCEKMKFQNFENYDFLNFGVLDMSSWLYIQFFMRNPNLTSKIQNFESQYGKIKKN